MKMIKKKVDHRGGIIMSETKQNLNDFDSQFYHQEMHRGKRYGKKKRSWVSTIIQAIVFILTAITGYSMLKQPIFNISFADDPINFHQLRNFQDTVTKIGDLNLNLGNTDDLQHSVDHLIAIFNVLFVLCLVSMFVTVITVILNRTVLKVLNILILASMLFITLYFSYIIHTIAQKISESLKQYYLTVSPNQVITEADAIHNALILLACSIALIIISLFFRNRLARIR